MNRPLEHIAEAVEAVSGIAPNCPSRAPSVITSRRAFIVLSWRHGYSNSETARYLGMDHTTIGHHLDVATKRLRHDPLDNLIDKVAAALTSADGPRSLRESNHVRDQVNGWAASLTAEERAAIHPGSWARLYRALGIDQ